MELYQALITLDGWTFLAQICNLMIQLLIFKKFLLNPVKKVIAERKAKADSQIADAAKLRTEAAWAIVVFVLIMYYKIKTNGILSYLKGLLDPIFIMAPINVLSELSTPVSMAFRHFGNILSGTVISTLLYWALASLSHVIFGWLPGFLSQIQLFQIGIPAFTGLYFDWFGGCIQAFIFCTLTAIFIKRAAGED